MRKVIVLKKEINRKEVQEWVKERFELSVERIREIAEANTAEAPFDVYFHCLADFILYVEKVYEMRQDGRFVQLTTKELARATDYCGVRSGRDVDKFKETGLTAVEATKVKAPLIAEAPVNIECRITEKKELGSHHMFLAEVLAVHVDEKYLDENGKFQLNKSGLIAYSHGEYLDLGKEIGTFGYSVKKKTKKPQKRRKKKVER